MYVMFDFLQSFTIILELVLPTLNLHTITVCYQIPASVRIVLSLK